MRWKRWALLGGTFLILIISVLFYVKCIPSGILLLSGVHKNDVVLVSDSNKWFHHYLYEKDGKLAGILTIQRKGNSLFWSKYYNSTIKTENKDGVRSIIVFKTSQPTIKNGMPLQNTVWGGEVALNGNVDQNIDIIYKGDIRQPDIKKKENGRIYFFYISNDVDNTDPIDVKVK
ncbi:hypothetical protein [Bacillus niameyensis]|uniref:hypothetical protein n=1 Tax=Bacillus niameyensis TaxID=1522308 RepID=UPI000785043E|nr:hypothetical protein [Bacillus niameyensis]